MAPELSSSADPSRGTGPTTVAIGCGVVVGVDAIPVLIEARMLGETSTPRILGSVDQVVREAYHRILSAFGAVGLPVPRGSPVLNFVPADVRKAGSSFDLPMALALAAAGGLLDPARLAGLVAFGEVTLDGRVRSSPGIVPVAIAARARGWTRLLTSRDDATLAAIVPGLTPLPVADLREAIAGLAAGSLTPIAQRDALTRLRHAGARAAVPDLADVRGHATAKDALVAAAAGRHDLLFVGPPGSGKSALLRRLVGILPPLGADESLEVLKVLSAHATLPEAQGSLSRSGRPFRAPHHTSSAAAVLGGGPEPRPGEVTLAHHGVLFLDELPEFRREVLEGLRQPLEDRCVSIGRARRTVTLPADFLLVAAMNPCPCGHANDPARTCSCTPQDRRRYLARISGPLLDRFDLRLELHSPPPEEFRAPRDPAASTSALAERVVAAMARQAARNAHALPHGRLEGLALDDACSADDAVLATLERAMRSWRVSARGRTRVLRLARTLADLADRDAITNEDVLLAIRLRGADR
ncbi:MAG: YifB family Mg chelatase-like AAA ATPase [Planctomycetes bacterium]|nr:YifB family Mg chelatase-like AAA ATPase [Planctomycetota bacterium]